MLHINVSPPTRKVILFLGILVNILLLGYYKYTNFFIENINQIFSSNLSLLKIVFPIGISFFSFQQIAYICDCYNRKTENYNLMQYTLFVSFFPQITSGPIVRYSETMPQFTSLRKKVVNWKNLSQGLLLFFIGLFKKVIIADTLGKWASLGFDSTSHLSFFEAISSILSYTFQIYYDFSGYTDMAIGVAKMLNIDLPPNFNNPYKAIDIQDFWRRWHMTLSKFLKDYIYIPLGGNRKGTFRTYLNILIVFFICGLWHGAGWMFIIWGLLHGIACVINRLWKKTNMELPIWLSWLITFVFLNFAWIFFRAKDLFYAKNIIKSALGFYGFAIPKIYGVKIQYDSLSGIGKWDLLVLILIPILTILIFINKIHGISERIKPNKVYTVMIIILFITTLLCLIRPNYSSPFIYYNF